MGSKVDVKFTALRDQEFTSAMSDIVLQWLQNVGATAINISNVYF